MVSEAWATRAGGPGPTGGGQRIPLYRNLRTVARDPLAALVDAGTRSGGRIVRLDLGLFRPYLVTHPEHIQHVFVDNQDNYQREGMLWRPVRGLLGDRLAGEGPAWLTSHRTVQPLFAGRYIDSLIDRIADAATTELDELEPAIRAGRPVDMYALMSRIVNRVVVFAVFGDRMTVEDANRLRDALMAAFKSLGPRMLLPFVPNAVPLPGSRKYRAAARTAADIMLPMIRQVRREGADGTDLVSLLCRAADEQGRPLTDEQVLVDMKSMFVGGGETAGAILTWLWVIFDRYPQVAARLCAEVDGAVGTGRPRREHLNELTYIKMVLNEVLRLYPASWILPRRAMGPDVLDGVPLEAGATILMSPYTTHRVPWLWERPERFDPERFAPGQARQRHKFAFFPFGGGLHSCLGSHFFTVEAQVIVATLLGRYRPVRPDATPVKALPRVSLQPGQSIPMLLRPVQRS